MMRNLILNNNNILNYFLDSVIQMGFPGGSDGKASACNAGDPGSFPSSGRSVEKEMTIHSILLPGKFHGQRSCVGYSPWGRKESDMTE